jgi:hypothetical protein
MLVKKQSVITGDINEMDLDVTQAELLRHIGGELAHKIWPQMSPPDREFMISGVTPQEWDEAFRCEGCEE